MRTFLFSILFLLVGFVTIAQTTVNRKIAQRYDEYSNSAWQGQDSVVFDYNAYGLESNRLSMQGQSNNAWTNFVRITTDYDGNGNLSKRFTELWQNGTWNNTTLYNYSYNASNSQTEVLYQTWNSGTNSWTNSGRILKSYNANQDLVKREAFSWNGSWQPTTKQDYVYTSANVLLTKYTYVYQNSAWQRLEKLDYQFAFGFTSNVEKSVDDLQGGWRPESRELSTINGSAIPPRIASTRFQQRDTANGVWLDSLRTIYSYSGNLLTQELKDKYNPFTTAWTDIYRYQYIYNGNNLLEEEIYFSTNSSTIGLQPDTRKVFTYNGNLNDRITFYESAGPSTWSETGRESFSYNGNDSLTYRLVEDYLSAAYVPSKQYFYYYDNIAVGLNDINNLFTNSTLYPNPSDDFIKIKTNESISGAFRATIFSFEGKKVWSQMSNKSTADLEFNISSLTKGQYIFQLTELSSGRSSQFKFQKK